MILSKTLRGFYKDPTKIAHKVLADRIAIRDPGNKPAINERIQYIYIKNKDAKLQGDKIETPEFITEMKLEPDYLHYITNQIMKPVSQIFELVVERLPKYPYRPGYFEELEIAFYNKYNGDLVKTAKKVSSEKMKLVKKLVFDPLIQYAIQKMENTQTIDKWFCTATSGVVNHDEDITPGPSSRKETEPNATSIPPPIVITGKKLKQTDLSSWFAK